MTTEPAAPTAPAEPRHLPLVLLTLALVLFTTSAQFLIVSPILPRIAEELTVSEDRLGYLVTAYAVAVGIFAIVSGPISDAVGRRTILRVGTAWMGVALLLHGLATSFETLMALRFLAGTASGILGGAAVAYVGDVVPYARRGRALGLVTTGFAFGQILGIPLGTVLAGLAGYRAPFVGFGVLMLLCSAMCWVVLDPSHRSTERLTLRSAFASYRWLLSKPELLAVNIASTTMMLSVSAYIIYQPLWMERTFAIDETWVAGLFAVGGLANAAMGAYAGALSDRVGRKRLVLGASVGLGVCMLITPFIPSFGALVLLFVCTMALVGVRLAPLNAWVTALVDDRHRGALMSLFLATGQIGFAVGSSVAGWTWHEFGFVGNAVAAFTAAMLTAVILAVFVPEPPRAG